MRRVHRGGVVNAYWGRDRVTLVERAADGGVRVREELAEHSCFIEQGAISPSDLDALRRHTGVHFVRAEGEWVRVGFRDRDACAAFCRAAQDDGVPTYEGCISPVVRMMSDRALKTARPRACYFDLETDSRVPFSRMLETTVLSWAVVGADGREATGVLSAHTPEAERQLLADLWAVLEDYDLCLAWSGDRFDFPVLKARSELHGLIGTRRDWRRWLWLDHMALFLRMNVTASESGEEKQMVGLNAVAKAIGVPGKIGFDASKTWEAWAAGGQSRRELVEYNLEDTRTMARVEDKTGYLELQLTLSEACGTFPDTRGSQPSVFVEGFLQRLAVERGHKFPTVLDKSYGEKFKGAYVMEPQCSGTQRDVHVCDFASLYPSIIISWNMSPETCMGVFEPDKRPATPHSWSPLTGACFAVEREGILAVALAELLRLRKYWNDLKASLPPGTPEWKEADRRATAYKIAANSFYGVVGQGVSRFFRRAVAEAVTQCGAWLILKTIEECEARGWKVIYADTDSCFVVGCSKAEFEAFTAWCNAELYPRLTNEVNARENRVKLAYEKAFNRLVFTKKKRYIGSYSHFKGTAATAESKPEIKGLEFKRGDSIRLVMRLQEEVAHHLVGYKTEPKDDVRFFVELMERWRDRCLYEPLELADVRVSKGLGKDLKDYARKVKKDGDYARNPPHVELARELQARGMDMNEGAKVEYVIVEKTGKHQKVVYAGDWDGELDRACLWAQQVAPPVLRLLEAAFPGYDWDPVLDVPELPADVAE